jgi:hypothetical protein
MANHLILDLVDHLAQTNYKVYDNIEGKGTEYHSLGKLKLMFLILSQ